MEFKKKTIIWEDNNEPPKDYIWIKSDGKAYEYSYSQRKWIESKLIKTEESGGSDESGSGEVDYEAIYQFYKKKIIESIPEEYLEQVIIPEHYADIEVGSGYFPEYENRAGIWYSDTENYNLSDNDIELFCEVNTLPFVINKHIYFGNFKYTEK